MKTHFFTLLFVCCLSSSFAQRTAPDLLPGKQGTLTVQPIVHASLVLTGSGKVIYVDPTGGASGYAGLAAPDIILITDIHGDHLSSATIDSVKTPNTILVVPQAVADKLPEADKARAVILKNGESTVQAGIGIRAIPMYNLPESPTAAHTRGRGNGYILTIAGKKVYISGDTQGIPEMRALTGIDVAFVCM
ncbi:MAG: MBL fold metallo-hydrolase, partial [Bacteroidota bacterium]|nr:MBL fold metallo-hydrolase [Bacteroidota bacterium]